MHCFVLHNAEDRKLHGHTMHQQYPTFYFPSNAHNVKKHRVIKTFYNKEAAPTCFGLQGNHHQEATAST